MKNQRKIQEQNRQYEFSAWCVIVSIILCGFIIVGAIICQKGRESAFDDILLEKCWVNKTTLDIDCIEHIRK